LGTATAVWGQAQIRQGHLEEGITALQNGLERQQEVAELAYRTGLLCCLAEAQAISGHPDEGLQTLVEALELVEQTGERYFEAELHRVRGTLLFARGDEAGAEASLQKALQVARGQRARSLELRAATSLACIWQKQGKPDQARQTLGAVYSWFTEGFDTPDLQEAKALLEEL
jgi:adenylate cyclase